MDVSGPGLNEQPRPGGKKRPVQIPAYPFILIAAVKRVLTIFDNCAHEIPETLEDPDPAVLCRSRTGFHYRERGQRCQRYRHLLAGGLSVWLPVAVDHDSRHPGADRGAGDFRPYGRGYRQGSERPDLRGV